MDKLLTIVIPTYNMEAYLERCLKSLIVSSEQMEQLEVLVINDGSKDRSSEIAHDFEAKYPQTYRVIDKENGNYGSCVNRGLKEAAGKYIKVLDADDWFDTHEFSAYISELNHLPDTDMILTDYQIVDNDGNMTKSMKYGMPYNKEFAFQKYVVPGIFFAMHSLTYRTDLLRGIDYRQTEGISYTDTEWVLYPQHCVNSCVYLKHDVYRYVMGREGQTMDTSVLIKSVGHLDKLIRAMVNFGNHLSAADKSKYSFQRLEDHIAHLSMGIYRTCLVLQSDDSWNSTLLANFDAFLKVNRPEIYQQAGNLKLKKYLPIRYVHFWRITGKRFSVDLIRDIYRKVRYGKK